MAVKYASAAALTARFKLKIPSYENKKEAEKTNFVKENMKEVYV